MDSVETNSREYAVSDHLRLFKFGKKGREREKIYRHNFLIIKINSFPQKNMEISNKE